MSYAQWSPTTTYAVNDVVEYAGLIYRATVNNQNVPPQPTTATWLFIGNASGGGGLTTITAGNPNITISGTNTNAVISGTLVALTGNVATSDFAFSGNSAGNPSFVIGGGEEFKVITTDLTPHIIVNNAVGGGVQLGNPAGYGGLQVIAPTVAVATTSDTQVATTAFVQNAITAGGGGGTLQSVVNAGSGISNFTAPNTATMSSTNFTSGVALTLNGNASTGATKNGVKMISNADSSKYVAMDFQNVNLNGTDYSWSSIVATTTPTLSQVLTAGNTATNSIILNATDTTNTIAPATTTQLYLSGTDVGRIDQAVGAGNASTFLGVSQAGSSNSLRTEVLPTGALIQHETTSGANQSMVIQSEGNIRMKGGYNSIINEVICSNSSAGIVMNGAGLTVNSLAGTVNTLNAGTNVIQSLSGNNTFITANTAGATNPNIFQSSGVESATNPLVRLDNTNATTNPAIMELYKSGKVGATSDVVSALNFFGKDGAGNKQQFGGIESIITSAGGGGGVDGALDFYSCVNGVKSLVFRMNGADNENNSFRPLDMNGTNLTTSSGDMTITTGSSSGTGNLSLASKGTTTLTSTGAISITNSAGSGDLNLSTGGSINMLDSGSTVLSLSSASGASFDLGGGAMNLIGASTRTIQTTGAGLNVVAGAGANGHILTLKSSPDQAIVLEGNSITANGASLLVPGSGGSSGQHLQITVNGTNYVIALLNP